MTESHPTFKRHIATRARLLAQLMRLDKPTGTWLLLWPCWWSLGLAFHGYPPQDLLLLFALGAFIMRSAGCVINDLADRRYDAQVARTRHRPLASGALAPYDALALLGALLPLALIIALQLHPALMLWAAGSLLLVAAYPFMKRITYWPQAFLGLTFNFGALLAWVALDGFPALPAWLLYGAGFCWTMGYDTIYAHQDVQDDRRVGVKSTALRFGRYNRQMIGAFYALMLVFLIAAGWATAIRPSYYIGLIPVALHLAWQVRSVDFMQPAQCMARFKANFWTGLLIYLAIVGETLIQTILSKF